MIASKSNNYAMVNFKQKAMDVKLFIVLMILNLMAFPYLMISMLQNGYRNTIFISFIAYALIFACGIYIPLQKFLYMNQKSKVDMVYALPLTRKQQFLSDYFAGLTLYVIPYLIQMILTQIILFVLRNIKIGYMFNLYRTKSFYEHQSLFKFMFIALLLMIFLYTLTVFIISCTGNLFEAITASVYFNFIIPLFFYTLNTNIIGSLYSISENELIYKILERTSPIGGLVYLIAESNRIRISWLLPYLLVIALLFLLSLKIQTKRLAEEVTKPFVVKAFYYTILSSIVFIIGSFLYRQGVGYINLIVILSVVFFIFEVITNRGIQKMLRIFVRYVVILSSVILFLFVFKTSDGFGLVYRKSNASNIKSITLNYDGILNQGEYQYSTIELKDPMNIERLLTFQESQLKKFEEVKQKATANDTIQVNMYELGIKDSEVDSVSAPDYIVDTTSLTTMAFDLKFGLDYSRYYDTSLEDLLMLAPIELSDEYIDQMIEAIYKINYVYISDIYSTKSFDLNETRSSVIKGLLEALRKDLKEISLEDYLKPNTSTGMKLYFGNGTKIGVHPSYTNTIQFLKDNNLYISLNESDYKSLISTRNVFLVAPESESEYKSNYYTSRVDYQSITQQCQITELTDDVATLLDNAMYQYVTDEPCYYLFIDNYRYVIPANYSEIASRVYSEFMN